MRLNSNKDDAVLISENLSKKFCRNLRRSMSYGLIDVCRSFTGFRPSSGYLRKGEFWAVKNISLELRKGEVLGLIGRNGSGKTTLLRILAGIYPPDKGIAETRGRVSTLLNLGVGFHPHMTVRESIFINGTILGLSHKEINDNFDYIIDFSGLKDFIGAPVSALSAGMYIRLSFSIAATVEPDIFLIDEVLAAGDREFREMSLGKIKRMAENAAVIFVAHSMETITKICNRIAVMEQGEVVFMEDNVSAGIEFYSSLKTNTA